MYQSAYPIVNVGRKKCRRRVDLIRLHTSGTYRNGGRLGGHYLQASLASCLLAGTGISELEREKRQLRLHIIPVIQAEQDFDYMKKLAETKRLEAIATADDPSWRVGESVYHRTDAPRTFFLDAKERGHPMEGPGLGGKNLTRMGGEAHQTSGTGGPAFGKLGPVRRTGPSSALPIKNTGDGIFAKPYDRPSSKTTAGEQRDSGVFTRLMDMMKGVMSSIFTGNAVNEQVEMVQEKRPRLSLSLPEVPIQAEAPVVLETEMQVEGVIRKKSASVLLSELILDNRFRRSKVAAYRQIAQFFEAKGVDRMTRYEADQIINILKRFVAPSGIEEKHSFLTTPAQSNLQTPLPPAMFRYTDTAPGLASRLTTTSSTANTTAFDTPVAPQPAFIDYQSMASVTQIEPIIEPRRVFSARFEDVMDDHGDVGESKAARTTTVFIPKTIEPSLNVKLLARPPIHPSLPEKSLVDEQIIKNLQAFIPPKPPAPVATVAQQKPALVEAEKPNILPPVVQPPAAIPKFTIIEPKPIDTLPIEPPKTKFDFGAPLPLDAPIVEAKAGKEAVKVGQTTATILDTKPAFQFGVSSVGKDESRKPVEAPKPFSLGVAPSTSNIGEPKEPEKPFSFGFGKSLEQPKTGFSFGQPAFGADTMTQTKPLVSFGVTSANQEAGEATKKPNFTFSTNIGEKDTTGGTSQPAFTFGSQSFSGGPIAPTTATEPAKQSAPLSSLAPPKNDQTPGFTFAPQPAAGTLTTLSSTEPTKPSPFSFGKPATLGLNFGSSEISDAAKPTEEKPSFPILPKASDDTPKPFTFGTSQAAFTFGQSANDESNAKRPSIEPPKPFGEGSFGKPAASAFGGAPFSSTPSGFSFTPAEPPKAPASQPTTASFSFPLPSTNEPAKAPTFTFGSTSTPALPSFGSAAATSSFGSAGTTAAPPFGSATTAPPFGSATAAPPFGSVGTSTAPFSFGAFGSANQAAPAASLTTSAFTFPAPSTTTPAFSFAPPTQPVFQFGQADPNASGFSIGSDPSPSGGSRKISTPVTRRRPR